MPTTAVESEIIETAVRSACRAPSLHNSQPWQWVFSRGQLQLFLDPSRVMTTDQSAREALIGCGAALDHLRVAMAAAGWEAKVVRFPSTTNSNYLASIDFTPLTFVTDRDRRRADAIWARHTDRLPFSAVTGWDSVEPIVRASGKRGPVHVDVLPEEMHPELAKAAEIADSLRLYNTTYQDELHWWTAPFEQSEGIPYSALVSAAEGDRVAIERTFPPFRRPERRLEVPEDNATIILLSTDEDQRVDALATGEALSAVLLEATMVGLATCPVTHITEVHVKRDLIRSLLDHDVIPQVLIRVGVVPVTEKAASPTPRRALSEVLRIQR
jgi:nitroreductase